MNDYLRLRLRQALDAIGAPDVPVETEVSRSGLGDVATGVALRLAALSGADPAETARRIVVAMRVDPRYIAEITIAGAGFIDVRYTTTFFHDRLLALVPRFDAWRSSPVPSTPLDFRAARSVDVPLARLRSIVVAETVERLRERHGTEQGRSDAPIRSNGTVDIVALNDDPDRPAGTAGSIDVAELLSELGEEKARYLLLAVSPKRPLHLDLARARDRSPRHDPERLRHLHAHIAGLLRFAAAQGLDIGTTSFAPLHAPEEMRLIRTLVNVPENLTRAATGADPSIVIASLRDVAEAFERFSALHRIIAEPTPRIRTARTTLAALTAAALAEGLGTLGIAAPDRL